MTPLTYASIGWPVLPLYTAVDGQCSCHQTECIANHPAKHPHWLAKKGVYGASTDADLVKAWANTETVNWGIACGNPLPGGGFLVVVDFDPRNGSDETVKTLPAFTETLEAKSGGQGTHFFYRSNRALKKSDVGPGIELLGCGSYVVAAPSVHVSGNSYAWINWGFPVQDLPEWLYEKANIVDANTNLVIEGDAKDTFMGAAFEAAGYLGDLVGKGVRAVRCPWAFEHTDGRGVGGDSSSVVLPPTTDSHFGGFKCHHSHCAGKGWRDLFYVLPKAALEQANKRFPREVQPTPEKPPAIPLGDDSWKVRLRWKSDKNGNTYVDPSVSNVVIILKEDPRWRGKVRWNEFERRVELSLPPWHEDYMPKALSIHWCDNDTGRLVTWLDREFMVKVSNEIVDAAISIVADTQGYHPLRDYFNGLDWDGQQRLDVWLKNYCAAKAPEEYLSLVGKWWLMQGVARVFQPACMARGVLVIEGEQHKGKSAMLRSLVPLQRWFSESEVQVGTIEGMKALQGKLIIEMQEGSSLKGKTSAAIKSFLTTTADDYRESYGRRPIQVPRQNIFAISTNETSGYLDDPSGNTRFWPVFTNGRINWEGVREIRDQLWAEAVFYYRRGDSWWQTEEGQDALFHKQQATRNHEDEWTGFVVKYLAGKTSTTVAEVLEEALNLPKERWDKGTQVRAGKLLGTIGFKKRSRINGRWIWNRIKKE